jgi:phosphatidylinositol alpha-1,6-mannosyltransferase
MWELYRRLTSEVVVAAGACPGDEPFDAATTDLEIRRLDLDFGSWGLLSTSSIEYIAAWRRTLDLVRHRRVTQVHCAKALPEGLLAYALQSTAGLSFWCFAHGEELRLASTSRELRLLTRKVLHGADRVIANSAFTRSVLIDEWLLPASRVSVMSPGVDTTRFTPGATSLTRRAQLGWTGKRVLLTVGTLQKRKGQDTVIRALPKIRAAHPDVLYAIAGTAVEREYLMRLAAEAGVADAVQFRDAPGEMELVDCYQECELFVMPNRQIGWDVEGFGIVLLEAQACGKPVIAGRSGGTGDAVDDGVTGCLVNGDSIVDVAAAVIRLLGNPDAAARMGRCGRERAVAQFDWARLADRFSHALLEIGVVPDSRNVQEVSAR